MSEERRPRCLVDPQNFECSGNCVHFPTAQRVDNAMQKLSPRIPTVAKILKSAGVQIPHVGVDEMAEAMRKDHLDPSQCQRVINGDITLSGEA